MTILQIASHIFRSALSEPVLSHRALSSPAHVSSAARLRRRPHTPGLSATRSVNAAPGEHTPKPISIDRQRRNDGRFGVFATAHRCVESDIPSVLHPLTRSVEWSMTRVKCRSLLCCAVVSRGEGEAGFWCEQGPCGAGFEDSGPGSHPPRARLHLGVFKHIPTVLRNLICGHYTYTHLHICMYTCGHVN